jgi:hypothetical protein
VPVRRHQAVSQHRDRAPLFVKVAESEQ